MQPRLLKHRPPRRAVPRRATQPAINDGDFPWTRSSSVSPADVLGPGGVALPGGVGRASAERAKVMKALETAFRSSSGGKKGAAGEDGSGSEDGEAEEGGARRSNAPGPQQPAMSWQRWLAYFQQVDAAAERKEELSMELKVRAAMAQPCVCICQRKGCVYVYEREGRAGIVARHSRCARLVAVLSKRKGFVATRWAWTSPEACMRCPQARRGVAAQRQHLANCSQWQDACVATCAPACAFARVLSSPCFQLCCCQLSMLLFRRLCCGMLCHHSASTAPMKCPSYASHAHSHEKTPPARRLLPRDYPRRTPPESTHSSNGACPSTYCPSMQASRVFLRCLAGTLPLNTNAAN
eukprot:359650-Chlamydomonas_euryale.AAC.20